MASTPKENAQTETWFAVLGRGDTPADGVEDYCTFLGKALSKQSIDLGKVRVDWFERGWPSALYQLWKDSKAWTENWILLQYTAMAWSRRGLAFGAVAVLTILRRRGVRTAVVFHEPFRQGGARLIDRLRGTCQDWIVRTLYKDATKAVFADPLSTISWLPSSAPKATFIPIGANIAENHREAAATLNRNGKPKTVVVFCLSDLPNRTREIGDIVHAMSFVRNQGLNARVLFLGRGTDSAESEIEQAFSSSAIEVVNLGLQDAEEVARILSESSAMLCVRGPLYPRRGSAIAGIACGLPIVAYEGAAMGTPLEEAGVELVPYGNRSILGEVLAKVLASESVWANLHQKSMDAQQKHFSWDQIAARLQESLIQDTGVPK